MKISLSIAEQVTLSLAAHLGPDVATRRRCRWLLALARGATVAAVARAAGVSRPTVYRYARLWVRARSPAVLSTEGARRVAPWRSGEGRGAAPPGTIDGAGRSVPPI